MPDAFGHALPLHGMRTTFAVPLHEMRLRPTFAVPLHCVRTICHTFAQHLRPSSCIYTAFTMQTCVQRNLCTNLYILPLVL